MIAGITDTEIKIIDNILTPYYSEYSFFFYGSRVKGNFEKISDLDILIKGEKEISEIELEDIKHDFDNSKLPYIVNFVDFHSLDDKFYKLIEPTLVKFK